jgi:hypothetical protein
MPSPEDAPPEETTPGTQRSPGEDPNDVTAHGAEEDPNDVTAHGAPEEDPNDVTEHVDEPTGPKGTPSDPWPVPSDLDPDDVAQWRDSANANAYAATDEQYLYNAREPHPPDFEPDANEPYNPAGDTRKIGTTNDMGGRYTEDELKAFGPNTEMGEPLAQGNTRFIRYTEKRLLDAWNWIRGGPPKGPVKFKLKPPGNKSNH